MSTHKETLEIIKDSLKDIVVLRKKAASQYYRPVFRKMLDSLFPHHGGRGGTALVFTSRARSVQNQNESVYALLEMSGNELITRPLSKCTATQLGHYLDYLILKSETSDVM